MNRLADSSSRTARRGIPARMRSAGMNAPKGVLLAGFLAAAALAPLPLLWAQDRAELTPAEQSVLESNPALKEQYLQLTRAQQLLLAEARNAKWHEQPEVQLRMERARDKALAESWLETVAAPPPDFPSEAELQAAWEQRKTAFATPRQYRLAQIFIACPAGADKTVLVKAEARLAAVKKRLAGAGEDFATIARSESEDKSSAPAGGEIGWLSDSQIQPGIRAAVVRLRKHEISAPIRLNDGWHILKCLDRREARAPSLEDCRAVLAQQLRAERMKANSEAYVTRLLQNAEP